MELKKESKVSIDPYRTVIDSVFSFRILLEKNSKSVSGGRKNSFFLKKPFDPVPKIQKPSKDSSKNC